MPRPRWLTPQERELWLVLNLLTEGLQAGVDAQLRRDHGLTQFEYYALVRLSGSPDRTASMSDLAGMVNGSLSRLSHAVGRLETRGWVLRRPSEQDRRTSLLTLTDTGYDALAAAAPSHVEQVRRLVFDRLDPGSVPRLVELLRQMLDPERRALVDDVKHRP
ncbi:MarR family winged helix-turn-helix transcriptional regulator [Lapillicoccus jejuensis]|uniref:DNA-binding MarR family transcriptional regulator n=1 Tax=Lapillicoccus jejuensis TaxID=402171 RepID=A0A542DZK7_9MICO|nr:MarR family transcriptional regulator [Lapillicoccus jejuensis]TQJ08496.1 DNA-binding MarR family transcriptional regulator [Lapillicoccus jejuensis]